MVFAVAAVVVPVATYGFFAVGAGHFTILVYVPVFAGAAYTIYLYISTSLRDPGVLPKRIIQIPRALAQTQADTVDSANSIQSAQAQLVTEQQMTALEAATKAHK